MKTFTPLKTLGALCAAAALLISAGNLRAQNQPGPGNFDPAEMRERMTERLREQFEVKDDAEWKLIADRVEKVMEARRATGGPGGPDGIRQQGERGRGGPGGQGGQNVQGGVRPQGERGPGGPGGFDRPTDPAVEALQKAIDAKASPQEIAAKLAALRAARKTNEAKLEKAQGELREVLSTRQEAVAVAMGLLK